MRGADHPDVPPVAESVLQKARMILGAFDAPSPQLGLSELARRTGLAKTTVHRVASEMVSVGLLARYGRRYELAPLLFEFGQRVPRTRALRLAASPFLEDLAIATRETVVLGTPGDHDVLFVEKFFGQRGGGTTVTKVEGRVPFHCGASGKVLLAFGDPALLEQVTAGPLRPRTPRTITDPERLRAEIARVRENGYAVERQEVVVGYGAVGAPVLIDGRALATITVVTQIDRLDVRRLVPAVSTAARALSRVIGTGTR
jgi:DNA-binding IclR family transcriptional regulator